VNAGRINFKQRDDKSPFALLDVSGRVDRDSAGRWQLDLEARPMRAGVGLQDIGTVRLRGTIAGTSARLQPAALNLTWRAASLADALRLAREQDYGIRGQLSLDLNARVAPPDSSSSSAGDSFVASDPDSGGAQWSISGVARMSGIHAWNLTGRATDPSANLSLDAGWRPGEARAQIRKLLVEMPGSYLHGTGELDWRRGFHPQLRIESSTLALGDVLQWYRSLRPEVSEDLRAEGTLGVDVTLGGWPLQLQHGTIASAGGTLAAKSLPALMRIGAVNAGVSHGGLDFAPTEFSFLSVVPKATAKTGSAAPQDASTPEGPSSFLLQGSISPDSGGIFRWPPNWNCSVEGATPRAEDLLILSGLLAQRFNSGWTASGGFSIKMRGTRRTDLPTAVWLGTLDFRDLALSPAYVNQPVRLVKTRVEYSSTGQTITVSAAEALGASWHGTVSRKSTGQIPPNSRPKWAFDLTADHLDTVELDRWLGPRARPGFLARFANFGSPAAGALPPGTAFSQLAAHGRLRVAEISLALMRFEQFDGEVELDGRAIKLRNAKADFFGGKTTGTFDARLVADPSYEFQGRFDRVNLAQLGAAMPWLNNRIAGTASAMLSLSTHGVGREALIAAMEGKGTLDARHAEIRGLDFTGVFPGESQNLPLSTFASIQGAFRVQSGRIDLANFLLNHSLGRLQADGRIDFSHALNIRIRPAISRPVATPASPLPTGFVLGGTIESPKFAIPSSAAKPVARSGYR